MFVINGICLSPIIKKNESATALLVSSEGMTKVCDKYTYNQS